MKKVLAERSECWDGSTSMKVIYDTHDPQRVTIVVENGKERLAHRCVYGYFKKREHETQAV